MADSLHLREQLQCCICLELFSLPVTIPCGHNFCKKCITNAWDVSLRDQCPLCKEQFGTRPELRVNTMLSEMSSQLRQTEQRAKRSTKKRDTSGDFGGVLCDVCIDNKQKAVKSCLVCVASFCEVHLEPHDRILGLKKHELIEPVRHLEDRTCKTHERPLELYCQTDRSFICQQCVPTDHRRHLLVPLKKQFERQKSALDQTLDRINSRIQTQQKTMARLEENLVGIQEETGRETAHGVSVLTRIIETTENYLSQLLQNMEDKQKAAENQVQRLLAEVMEEISGLQKDREDLQTLAQTEDHLWFLKKVSDLDLDLDPDQDLDLDQTGDGVETEVHVSLEGSVRAAVRELQDQVSIELQRLTLSELTSVQRFSVDVCLDPDTAHPALILSDDLKEVYCSDAKLTVPYSPSRFTDSPCVLAQQRFQSGKFYYEVGVQNKTKWYLGVAKESVNRKGQVAASPAMGLWAIWLKNVQEYRALDEPAVALMPEKRPERIGVFVDYGEGLVSFYDADTGQKIYCFRGCKFNEKLRPFFGPCTNDAGRNAAPLVVTQVKRRQSET